jgi:hypothetical protein
MKSVRSAANDGRFQVITADADVQRTLTSTPAKDRGMAASASMAVIFTDPCTFAQNSI